MISGDSNPGKIGITVGGVGRNIADNLARLGQQCYLLSAVGTDALGQMITDKTKETGVSTEYILAIDDVESSIYLSVVDEHGDLSVAVNDMTAAMHISPDYIEKHNLLLSKAKIIIIDANLPTESLDYIARNFSQQYILADGVSTAKVTKFADIIGSINGIKLNLAESRMLSGDPNGEPEDMASWFRDQGCENIFITLGAEGVYYQSPDQWGFEKSLGHNSQVKNVTGAGDAFVAGVACGYLEDWDIKKSVKFASCAGFLTARSTQSINPNLSQSEVMRLME